MLFSLFRVRVMDREPEVGAPRMRLDWVVVFRKAVFWYA